MSPAGGRGALTGLVGQVWLLRKFYGCDHRVAGSAAEHSAIFFFVFSFLGFPLLLLFAGRVRLSPVP